MRNILRKLHIGNNHYDRLEAERVSPESTPTAASSSSPVEQKPSSMFSGWLSAVAKHGNQGSSSENQVPRPRVENTAAAGAGAAAAIPENSDTDADNILRESFYEEEYQMQLAMALSVSKFESSVDPEALEFEAAKEMSLGLSPKRSSQAEVVAYRYWAYNVLTYEDRVADGFYDVYGVFSDPKISERMPSLIDLQGTPLSDSITCEVILVSRITDPDLVALELKARRLAVACQAEITGPFKSGLVQEIAELVAHHMGGPVISDVEMLAAWRTSSWELKASLQSIVLPLGALRIGLARHRALLFKVLADCSGIPCRLVKGRHYTGVDDGAVNILKGDDGGEYIIDLMGAPGAVIPPDATASYQSDAPTSTVAAEGEQIKDVQVSVSPCIVPDLFPLPCSEVGDRIKDAKPPESVEGLGTKKYLKKSYRGVNSAPAVESSVSEVKPGDRRHSEPEVYGLRSPAGRSTHSRSPSWTEGIGSPAAQELKVQYMMDAAKENPELAQKLQDVLRESGVEAPADLFLDLSLQQMHDEATEERQVADDAIERREGEDGSLINREVRDDRSMRQNRKGPRIPKAKPRSGLPGRPPLASARHPSSGAQEAGSDSLQRPNFVEGSAERQPVEIMATASATRPTVTESMVCLEELPLEPKQHISVASQVSSAVLSSPITTAGESKDSFFEMPAVPIATDTAEAVTASAGAVREGFVPNEGEEMSSKPHRSFVPAHNSFLPGIVHREAQSSDLSSQPSRQGSVLEDAAEWEVPWEDITLGERIGLGSYGEVYRGEWHGTEIAVKKFLDQDFSGDALDEFRSEVRIMRRLRHPNVVLFMGAVTRPPHLSIVTEYLPRGSLYKLIHRPHNQLDERRRLRMALDVARGMNYLHSSAPVIVHRDLKSPNLLVDKNWVVKVCDFGLSRLKHNTFLSSRSMAGTPEWMAPEVLRNEPSNEKSDVYSFGVILWELATLQQPWSGMNPMQVVGAVGFQHRRLQIPKDMDPSIASIIHDCWLNDPNSRPSFAEILNSLKPLQRPVLSAQPEASKQLSGYQLQRKYEQPLLHMFDSPISKVNFGVLPSQVSGPTDVPIGH